MGGNARRKVKKKIFNDTSELEIINSGDLANKKDVVVIKPLDQDKKPER